MSRVTEETLNEMKGYLTKYIDEVSHLNPDFKFRCFNNKCHNHGDRNPSASIIPKSYKTKWKCFACGISGDIFKAVELYEGISSFYNQVKFLSQRYGIPIHKENDFENYAITNYYYRDENNNLLYRITRRDFKNGKKFYFDRYVNGIWQKGLGDVRRVMYNLPKIKEYIKKDEPFFLVEGEKCAKALENLGLGATTSCGGANGFERYAKDYIENLKGGRVVIIPDNDEPGYKYAESAFNALKKYVKSIKVLKLDNLDLREDIFDWIKKGGNKEKLIKLCESAYDYMPKWKEDLRLLKNINTSEEIKVSENIIKEDGCYYRASGEKKICLSNFIITPKYMICTKEQDFMHCKITPQVGKEFERDLTPENFDDLSSFRKALGDFSISFTGNLSDLQHIKSYIASSEMIKKQGVYYSGFHKINTEWIYVDSSGALDKDLKVKEQVVLLEGYEEQNSNLFNTPLITGEELKVIAVSLFNFNELYICSTLLGYTASLFLKGKLRGLKIKHNHLLIEGPSGSGKSSSIENIMIPILAMDNSVLNAADCTPFALTKLLSSSNLFPGIIDEYKPSKIEGKKLNLISSVMRNSYDFHKSIKGNINLQKNKEFQPISSVILSGEAGVEETANLERSLRVIISPSNHNEKYLKSFNNLKENSKLLNKLGKSILKEALKMEDNTLLELYNCIYKSLCSVKITSTRVRNSVTNCILGIYLITNVFNELNLNLEKCTGIKINDIIKSINEGAISDLLDYSNNNKSVLDDTLETINRMAVSGCIDEGIHYDTSKIDGIEVLRLNYVAFYDDFLKYCKDHNLTQETLSLKSFKNQLSKSNYCLYYDKPTTFRTGYDNGSRRKTFRAAILDIEKLKEKNLEVDFLINR